MILVTGGTGLVGSHLLLQLVRSECDVRATYRKSSNLKRIEKIFAYYDQNARELFEKIEWVLADLNDIPSLETAFQGITHVYHCAALISFDPKDYDILHKINAQGTANIVNLCLVKNIKKLCHVSTIGAIGKSSNGNSATEENEWAEEDTNVYALTKHAAEMEVWRGSQEGLPVIIVNPGVIVGPGFWQDGSGNLFTTANKGYAYFPPGGTGFITIGDLIRIMTRLMDSSLVNQRYITVAQNITFEHMLGLLTKHLGKPKPTKKLAFWQLEIGRIFDMVFSLFTGKARRITKNSIRSLKIRDLYDNTKIKKELNFEFEPLEETVQFSCARFIEENP